MWHGLKQSSVQEKPATELSGMAPHRAICSEERAATQTVGVPRWGLEAADVHQGHGSLSAGGRNVLFPALIHVTSRNARLATRDDK
jgi:hypothetical protein